MFRTVTINKVMNGWVVNVGCQTLVFNSSEAVADNLRQYMEHPEQVENRFRQAYPMIGDPVEACGTMTAESTTKIRTEAQEAFDQYYRGVTADQRQRSSDAR